MNIYNLPEEHHTTTLKVTCPECLREKTLTIAKRNVPKFVGEWCDGESRKRHPLKQMLGPFGEPNR